MQRGENRIAAEQGHRDDQRHQSDREDDQVVADLQHGALEMARGMRLLHQFGRLAEIGVRASGVDQCADFTLANDRPRKHRVPRLARSRERFPRQGGLIDLDRVTVEKPCVRRHDVAQAQADNVARHQLPRRRGNPLSVAYHSGLDRQRGLERRDGITSLMFLPEADHGVGQKQRQDDSEIRPVPGDRRKNHGRFDHPRDGPPEMGKEFQELVGLLRLDLVRTVLRQPLFRLGLRQAVRR